MNQQAYEELANAAHVHKMLADSGYSEKAIQYFLQTEQRGKEEHHATF